MVPRPPPHPRLGKNKLPRAKKVQKKHLFNDFRVQTFPKWSSAPPPHPQLGLKKTVTRQKNNTYYTALG